MSKLVEDTQRYRGFLREETQSAMLYAALAEHEHDPRLAEIYRKMAATETRHADVWKQQLQAAKSDAQPPPISWRTHALLWMIKRFGTAAALPLVTGQERDAGRAYATDPTARAAGMDVDESSHARIFSTLQGTGAGMSGAWLAQFEGRHRATGGGNALRAAVLGASDGLTSNMSLVMGVAGANLSGNSVLLTGFAGLLAGGLSMAIGEWLSVRSARELFERQIAIERGELQTAPAEEREELALIYEAKGLDTATAQALATRIVSQGDVALDTLAREELGIDPKELGGGAMVAAVTSFLLFSIGAIIPVLPFIVGNGTGTILLSILFSVIGLFVIGVGISLTTGVSLIQAGGRQVILGLLAAATTFGLGKLIGGRIG